MSNVILWSLQERPSEAFTAIGSMVRISFIYFGS